MTPSMFIGAMLIIGMLFIISLVVLLFILMIEMIDKDQNEL